MKTMANDDDDVDEDDDDDDDDVILPLFSLKSNPEVTKKAEKILVVGAIRERCCPQHAPLVPSFRIHSTLSFHMLKLRASVTRRSFERVTT